MSSSVPNDETIDQNLLLKYTVLTKMGSGAYGHVWKVTDNSNQQTYALKKVYSAFQNQLDAERTYREISILKKLSNTNVVKLQKVFRASNDFDLYLVFQFVEGDLFKAIKGNILEQSHKKYIIYQIAKSLKYVHSAGVIHRDIKPSNILIDSDCKIKICDFGLSRTTFSPTNTEPVITEFIATRWYRAPQVMLGSKSYSYKSDIWSFACLIYEMYAYKALLPGKDNIDQIEKLLQFKGFPNEEEKKSLNVNGIDKILGHFTTEKKDLSHYFAKIEDIKLKKLLMKMFEYDPNKRPCAEEILQHPFLEELKNYEEETVAQAAIQLEQNEDNKLTSGEYKQIIYDIFAEKQSQKALTETKDKPPISPVQNQKQKNHHKAIVERTLKKKSSHLIKNNTSSVLESTTSKLTSAEEKSKTKPPSMAEIPPQKVILPQTITEPLYLQNGQDNSSFIKQKIDRFKMAHNRNTSIMIIEKPHFQKNRPDLNESRFVHQKRTLKYSSLHEEAKSKEEEDDDLQEEKRLMGETKKSKKSEHKKVDASLSISPYKSRLSVSKKGKDKVSSIYGTGKKAVILPKENKMSLEKVKTRGPIKNSVSMHSSMNSSVCEKDKLPQLIIKPRGKIVSKGKENVSGIEKRPFNEVTNNLRQSEQVEGRLKREQSFMEIKTKKLQKKGISQLYNKEG